MTFKCNSEVKTDKHALVHGFVSGSEQQIRIRNPACIHIFNVDVLSRVQLVILKNFKMAWRYFWCDGNENKE